MPTKASIGIALHNFAIYMGNFVDRSKNMCITHIPNLLTHGMNKTHICAPLEKTCIKSALCSLAGHWFLG